MAGREGREGGYELIARLASGGMGEIFVARMVRAGGFRKLCVIKRVLPQYAGSEDFTTMLLEEARLAAQMTHSNICQVYDFGLMDGHYFMAMEYLAGVSISDILRHYARRRERIDERMVAAIVYQACMGLDYAHHVADLDGRKLELVHRDISPANLMVTTSGIVKVLDFGVAKAKGQRTKTKSGVLKGKVAYMAPEQIEGNPVDLRADIFSLGVVMMELFTGRRLFPITSEYETLKAIVEDPIPSLEQRRPDLPPSLARVVDRALARKAADRFASAGDLAEALAEAMVPLGGLMSGPELQRVLASEMTLELENQRALIDAAPDAGVTVGAQSPLDTGSPTAVAAQSLLAPEAETVANTRAIAAPPLVRPLVEAPETRADLAATAARADRGRVGRLAILVAIPALISAAIVFVVLGQRPGEAAKPAPTSVVVYQTELATPADTGPAAPRDDVAAASDNDAAAEPVTEARSEPTRVRRRARGKRDRYKSAIGKRRGALLGCFERVTSVDGAPKISLEMHIASTGKVERVSVLPASVGSSAVGRCVADEIRGIDFGRHAEAVTVTIPLVIRSK